MKPTHTEALRTTLGLLPFDSDTYRLLHFLVNPRECAVGIYAPSGTQDYALRRQYSKALIVTPTTLRKDLLVGEEILKPDRLRICVDAEKQSISLYVHGHGVIHSYSATTLEDARSIIAAYCRTDNPLTAYSILTANALNVRNEVITALEQPRTSSIDTHTRVARVLYGYTAPPGFSTHIDTVSALTNFCSHA